jgi:phosphate-selective porin
VAAVVMPAAVHAQTASPAQTTSEEQTSTKQTASRKQPASREPATSDKTSRPDAEADVFTMDDGPSLRLGDHARVDLHARIQADVSLQDESAVEGDRFAWGNRRVGASGVLFKRVEFQIERELSVEEPWRDVFADVRVHRALRIRAGHFKVPFSMERTTSAFELDFIGRAASVTDISPGRETGIMLHGRGPRRFFEYEFGVFRLAAPEVNPFVIGRTADLKLTAGRVTLTPGTARIGIAFTESPLPEGFHNLSGHFDDEGLLSSEDVYVNGRRRRIGIEGRWRTGRLTLKGELLRQAESRQGESAENRDLPDLIVDGGYISGLWRVVGSPRRARRAVDLAVRVESLGVHSADQSDAPSLSPRAENIAPLRQRALTFGANWLVTRWVKVQFNAIRESFVDEAGIRPQIPEARWRSLMRLQFAM